VRDERTRHVAVLHDLRVRHDVLELRVPRDDEDLAPLLDDVGAVCDCVNRCYLPCFLSARDLRLLTSVLLSRSRIRARKLVVSSRIRPQ
jgi:hypothetical protein